MVCAIKIFNQPFLFKVPSSSPYNLILDLYWLKRSLNFVVVETTHCFIQILHVNKYTTHSLLQ